MSSFAKQFLIELKIYLRQPLYILFSLIMPVASFVFFGKLYSSNDYGGMDFFSLYIPGFCMLILFATSVFNVGNQIISDKEKGIYRRIAVTPIKISRFIGVILLKAGLLAIIGFLLIILVAIYMFNIEFGIEKISFLLAYIIFIGYSLLLGIGIALLIDKIKTYTVLMMTLFFPMFFLSDATLPLTALPKWAQNIAEFNPLYHANKILRPFWDSKFNDLYSNGELFKSYLILGVILLAIYIGLFVKEKMKND